MKSFVGIDVAKAHVDAQEGIFHNRAIHERDRQAKFGFRKVPKKSRQVHQLDSAGLIPAQLKIEDFSSESRANGKLAANAVDGDPRTHWHTQFLQQLEKHPHELIIDLGRSATVRGIRYLARQDASWNGALAQCEIYVSDSPTEFQAPVAKTTFRKVKFSQEVTWEPVPGRYVLLKIFSEVNGGPWASISELGVIGE